jgi:hypothetical protein
MSMNVPSSVEVIGEGCFLKCELLTSVTFEADSKLVRFEKSAFCDTGLMSIHIPSSVEVIGES